MNPAYAETHFNVGQNSVHRFPPRKATGQSVARILGHGTEAEEVNSRSGAIVRSHKPMFCPTLSQVIAGLSCVNAVQNSNSRRRSDSVGCPVFNVGRLRGGDQRTE